MLLPRRERQKADAEIHDEMLEGGADYVNRAWTESHLRKIGFTDADLAVYFGEAPRET